MFWVDIKRSCRVFGSALFPSRGIAEVKKRHAGDRFVAQLVASVGQYAEGGSLFQGVESFEPAADSTAPATGLCTGQIGAESFSVASFSARSARAAWPWATSRSWSNRCPPEPHRRRDRAGCQDQHQKGNQAETARQGGIVPAPPRAVRSRRPIGRARIGSWRRNRFSSSASAPAVA